MSVPRERKENARDERPHGPLIEDIEQHLRIGRRAKSQIVLFLLAAAIILSIALYPEILPWAFGSNLDYVPDSVWIAIFQTSPEVRMLVVGAFFGLALAKSTVGMVLAQRIARSRRVGGLVTGRSARRSVHRQGHRLSQGLALGTVGLGGIAIGTTIALSVRHWEHATDAIANLWGGLIGSGLGAGLAILGTIIIQRRDRKNQLAREINLLLATVESVSLSLEIIQSNLVNLKINSEGLKDNIADIISAEVIKLERALSGLPDAIAFPREIYAEVSEFRRALRTSLRLIRSFLEIYTAERTGDGQGDDALKFIKECLAHGETITSLLEAI
jgi:hypothetical protein